MSRFLGQIITGTNQAILFQDHFWHEPEWLPRSQIVVMTEAWFPVPFQEYEIHVAEWLCKKRDMREFTERLPKEDTND